MIRDSRCGVVLKMKRSMVWAKKEMTTMDNPGSMGWERAGGRGIRVVLLSVLAGHPKIAHPFMGGLERAKMRESQGRKNRPFSELFKSRYLTKVLPFLRDLCRTTLNPALKPRAIVGCPCWTTRSGWSLKSLGQRRADAFCSSLSPYETESRIRK
jgi:hypothetical protein